MAGFINEEGYADTYITTNAADGLTITDNTIVADGTNANIDLVITPKAGGAVVLDGLDYPMADGGAGECIITNGAAVLAFGVLTVPGGGTGINALTDHAVLVGSGAGAITPIGVGATGTVLIGNTGADPSFSANPVVTTIYATTFDTNVAAAAVTLTGTTLLADGTDANIDINITPKGTGQVNISSVDIASGEIDDCTLGTNSPITEAQIDNININGNTIQSTAGNLLFESPASSQIVFNEAGIDVDFRVEGSTYINLLFCNAGTNRVGIGTSIPSSLLEISEVGATFDIDANATGDPRIRFLEAGIARWAYSYAVGGNYFFIRDEVNARNLLQFWDAGYSQFPYFAGGYVSMPVQPAFLATQTAAQNNLPINATTTLTINNEIFDQNADYNAGTYTLTAPATGKCDLNVTVTLEDVDSASTIYTLWLNTSNRNYSYTFNPSLQLSADGDVTFTLSVLADMDAADTSFISIQISNDGAAQADVRMNVTTFSGNLEC